MCVHVSVCMCVHVSVCVCVCVCVCVAVEGRKIRSLISGGDVEITYVHSF